MKHKFKTFISIASGATVLAMAAGCLSACTIVSSEPELSLKEKFERISWNDLASVANRGIEGLCEKFECSPNNFIGLEKTVHTSSSNEDSDSGYKVRVIGIDDDEIWSEDGYEEGYNKVATLTFQFENVFSDENGDGKTFQFNNSESGDIARGWEQSDVKNQINTYALDQFPDLYNAITPVHIQSGDSCAGIGTYDFNSPNFMFLPSLANVFSADTIKHADSTLLFLGESFPQAEKQKLWDEGHQYPYYKRIISNKSLDDDVGKLLATDLNNNPCPTMFRSTSIYDYELEAAYTIPEVYYVAYTNYLWHSGTTDNYYVNPCFCIGQDTKTTFENDTWENVVQYANRGIDALAAHYGLKPNDFVGKVKRLNVWDTINNKEVDFKVRVIGVTEDKISTVSLDDPEKAIGHTQYATLTFQFENALSDGSGLIKDDFGFDPSLLYNWDTSNMKLSLMNRFDGTKFMLPFALYNGLQLVSKTSFNIYSSIATMDTAEMFFLPSIAELYSKDQLMGYDDPAQMLMLKAILRENDQYSYYENLIGRKSMSDPAPELIKYPTVSFDTSLNYSCGPILRTVPYRTPDAGASVIYYDNSVDVWGSWNYTNQIGSSQNSNYGEMPCFCIGVSDNPTVTFENDSWENVIYWANQGIDKMSQHYGLSPVDFIGKQKEIMLKFDGELALNKVRVVDVVHDRMADSDIENSEKTTLTFQFDNLITKDWTDPIDGLVLHKYNDVSVTLENSLWKDSSIRSWLNDSSNGLLSTFPQDFFTDGEVTGITQTAKTSIGFNESMIDVTNDWLYLPSISNLASSIALMSEDFEMFELGLIEGTQFDYYASSMYAEDILSLQYYNNLSAVGLNGTPYMYWCRTPFFNIEDPESEQMALAFNPLSNQFMPGSQTYEAAILPCFNIGDSGYKNVEIERSWTIDEAQSEDFQTTVSYPLYLKDNIDTWYGDLPIPMDAAYSLYFMGMLCSGDYRRNTMLANDLLYTVYSNWSSGVPVNTYRTDVTVNVADCYMFSDPFMSGLESLPMLITTYTYHVTHYDKRGNELDSLDISVNGLPLMGYPVMSYGFNSRFVFWPVWLDYGMLDYSGIIELLFLSPFYQWSIAGWYYDQSGLPYPFDITNIGIETAEIVEVLQYWFLWSETLSTYVAATPYMFSGHAIDLLI